MLKSLLEQQKEIIKAKEDEKRIQRRFSENLIKETLEMSEKALFIKTAHKSFSQKLKLKLVDNRLPTLYTDLEALRHLIEAELDRFKIKKIIYRTRFDVANQVYFPYLYQVGEFRTDGLFYKVDISSCFYNIYSRLGIDSKVIADIDIDKKIIDIKAIARGLVNVENSEVIKELEKIKILRNALFGLTRCAFQNVFYRKQVKRQYFRGRLQNLDLNILIASFLHSIGFNSL